MEKLKDGEPCNHPGCLNHMTHSCEGCGRIHGRTLTHEECLNEIESELLQRISDIQQEYKRAIDPYIKQLAKINAMKPPKPIFITPEQWDQIRGIKKNED